MNKDNRSMELARVLFIDVSTRVVISPSLWADPAPWGILLADMVQHLGDAYEAKGKKALRRSRESFKHSTPKETILPPP
jgi:Domain of unknown function (DUF5076)